MQNIECNTFLFIISHQFDAILTQPLAKVVPLLVSLKIMKPYHMKSYDCSLARVSRKLGTRSSRSLSTIEPGCGASSQLLFAYCPQTNNPPPQRPAHAAPRVINHLICSANFSRRDVSSFPLRCRVFPRCPLVWPRHATLRYQWFTMVYQ